MRILALAPELPFPPNSGGKTRTYHLLRALSREHEVTLVAFSDGGPQYREGTPLPLQIEVVSVPQQQPRLYSEMYGTDPDRSKAAHAELARDDAEPWFVSHYACPLMETTLERVSRREFDLILIEHTFMARFLPALSDDVPKILDLHNLHSLMSVREANATTRRDKEQLVRESARTRRFERDVCNACRSCWVCSEEEAAAARDLLGVRHVWVIPNGVDTSARVAPDAQAVPGYLLFTGTMNYGPNVEAAVFFARGILPRIRAAAPAAVFHIVGAKPTPQVRALASQQVVVHGEVSDMRPYFQQAQVVVVPLLHGGGTRLKILDAAACGKAIVTTPLGAEGLSLRPGEDALFASSPQAFADAVLRLLAEPSMRTRIGRNARVVAERYDWSLIGRRALDAVRATVHGLLPRSGEGIAPVLIQREGA